MMKGRLSLLSVKGLALVALAAALSGCVSLGNTHAFVTPVGAIGYHTFKPENAPQPPRDINLRRERVAATNEHAEQSKDKDEI